MERHGEKRDVSVFFQCRSIHCVLWSEAWAKSLSVISAPTHTYIHTHMLTAAERIIVS